MVGSNNTRTRWPRSPFSRVRSLVRHLREREARLNWTMSVMEGAWAGMIIITGIVLLLPLPRHMTVYTSRIILLMAAYTVFSVFLELASIFYERREDKFFKVARILANTLTVSGLIYMSGGEYSYFWFFYLLPLFQSIVYLERGGVFLTAAGVTLSFWLAALLCNTRPSELLDLDYARLLTNNILLGVLAYVFYWLLGSAEENKKLQLEEMEELRQIALQIASQLNPKELLELIIRSAIQLLKGVNGGIYLRDDEPGYLVVVADSGGQNSIRGFRLAEGHGMAWQVVQTKRPLRVADYGRCPWQAPDLDARQFKAVIEVPLEVKGARAGGDEIIGVLYVTDVEDGRVFSDRDERLLRLLASQAAVAIQNAEAFTANQKNLSKISLLYDLSTRLNSATTLRDILEVTLDEALRAVRTDEGSIMVLDSKAQELEITAWMVGGELKDELPTRKLRVGEGVAGKVAADKEACIASEKEPGVWLVYGEQVEFVPTFTGRKLRTILCVPIISQGRLLCIINADSSEADFFQEGDKELLADLASQVAIAIESQQLRDVGRSLGTLTLEQLHLRIVESACYLTSAEASSLFFENKKTGALERGAVFPKALATISDTHSDDSLTLRIIREQKHLKINDAQTSPLVKQSLKDRGVKALMGAPLNVRLEGGQGEDIKTLGVLFVSTTQDRVFTERDAEIHQSLANQAAIAVANARLISELNDSIDYQKSLVASALDAIVSIDRNGLIREFNPSAERILGWRKEEVQGKHVGMLYFRRSEATHVARELFDRRRQGTRGRLHDYPMHLKRKDGERVSIRLSASLLEDGSVGFFQDQEMVESVRRHIEQLKDLFDAGRDITAPDDIQQVLRATVTSARLTLKAELVCLYSYDDARDEVRLPPIREELLFPDEVALDVSPHSIVGRMIRYAKEYDEIYFTDDAQGDARLGGDFAVRERVRAAAACPLKVKGKIVGLMFCNYRNTDCLSDEEKALIRVFARDAAIAIDHAQLYEEAGLKAEQLFALSRAIPSLVDSLPYETCLKSVLERARDLTHAEYGAIGLVDHERRFQPFIAVGVDQQTQAQIGSPPSTHGFLGDLMRGRQAVNLPLFQNPRDLHAAHPKITSFLGVPIQFRGEPLGNLYVANKRTAVKFSQEDVAGLRLLANLIALYVRGGRDDEEERAQTNFDIISLVLSWWADNVVGITADISAELRHLRQDLLGTTYEAGLKNIGRAVGKLNTPGSQLRTWAQDIGRRAFNLSQLLHQLLNSREANGMRVVRHIEEQCLVRGNQLFIQFALDILFNNAVDAIRRTGLPGTLRVDCVPGDQEITVSVIDTGDGIPQEIQKDLFQRPVPGRGGAQESRASLAAASIIRLHGGRISIARTVPGQGTVIEFRLPEGRD